MPEMDGCLLCQKIRADFKQEDLAIIGMSSEEEKGIGARFIKSGANDFIVKRSFLVEEFYCRVNHCVESIELFAQIKEAAVRDVLTGLHNRRYFFDAGEMLFASSSRDHINLVCAMVDIDLFKKVNDSYGHNVGDLVIQQVASLIQQRMRSTDIVARFGGEEFIILAVNMGATMATTVFEELRQLIEQTPVFLDEKTAPLHVSISIGVCTKTSNSLEEMTIHADTLLYEAKESGRNCIRVSS